jgi:hypothetical protein
MGRVKRVLRRSRDEHDDLPLVFEFGECVDLFYHKDGEEIPFKKKLLLVIRSGTSNGIVLKRGWILERAFFNCSPPSTARAYEVEVCERRGFLNYTTKHSAREYRNVLSTLPYCDDPDAGYGDLDECRSVVGLLQPTKTVSFARFYVRNLDINAMLAELHEYFSCDISSHGTTAHETGTPVLPTPPASIQIVSAPPPDSTETCPICLDNLREPVTSPCGHVFCDTCISESCKASKLCPVCRKKINQKQLIRLFLYFGESGKKRRITEDGTEPSGAPETSESTAQQ